MQAGCHATRVISRPNSVADEPFASTNLQLCAYNLEQSGDTARPYGLAIALDARHSRARARSGFALPLPLDKGVDSFSRG